MSDLSQVIEEVKNGDKGPEGNMVALYGELHHLPRKANTVAEWAGLGATSVGPHVVAKVAETYLDVLYE